MFATSIDKCCYGISSYGLEGNRILEHLPEQKVCIKCLDKVSGMAMRTACIAVRLLLLAKLIGHAWAPGSATKEPVKLSRFPAIAHPPR